MYGQPGILSYDENEDKVQCHICGRWFRSLATHVNRRHGWSADDYREEFGLNRGQSLICEGMRQKLSILNKQLGNWKHLHSQTMTPEELNQFLRGICTKPGYSQREQASLLKSEILKRYNPMNQPEVQIRKQTTLHESWYGSPRMLAQSRRNHSKMIETIRARNLAAKKWVCRCGQAFPTKTELQSHRQDCKEALKLESQRISYIIRLRS